MFLAGLLDTSPLLYLFSISHVLGTHILNLVVQQISYFLPLFRCSLITYQRWTAGGKRSSFYRMYHVNDPFFQMRITLAEHDFSLFWLLDKSPWSLAYLYEYNFQSFHSQNFKWKSMFIITTVFFFKMFVLESFLLVNTVKIISRLNIIYIWNVHSVNGQKKSLSIWWMKVYSKK